MRLTAQAAACRASDPAFAAWAAGYGMIRHAPATQVRIDALLRELTETGTLSDRQTGLSVLRAADRLASAALWLTVHMTYANSVHLDGRALHAADCKPEPQGHTGGALNMALAYVAYLTLNALTGITRAWVMGQGHCVAAIDACNLLINNLTPAHAARYDVSDAGLTRFVRDFYAYGIGADGRPASPLGSHVNPNTAGGISEGGYLGFTELQYVHMPLPGERLVAFLSDGAWEEQRGSDWAARWWRAEDCGFAVPVMIANGRRLEQRTQIAQQGGPGWLADHLRLNGFAPEVVDGQDPAALVAAIWHAEAAMAGCLAAVNGGEDPYPFALPYVIADCIKGFGFPGAGLNRAHNLPLAGNPARDAEALADFNAGAARLHVPPDALHAAIATFAAQDGGRPAARDHALMRHTVAALTPVVPAWAAVGTDASPMQALDGLFCRLSAANPGHRVRVGNPDELASNAMTQTLARCRHRVLQPEPGLPEAHDGSIISALNEEAVVSAALANKGGLNLVVSYEAFATKMLGALRQEMLFARHQKQQGRMPQWLAVPLLLTSHTWENGKNEQSHQDPTLCEALLGEMGDTAVVRFPVDANSAAACLADAATRRGEIHALVVSKRPMPVVLDGDQAVRLVTDGSLRLAGDASASVQLIAVGALQLGECRKAWQRLRQRGIAAGLTVLLEPGRFREARDALEASTLASPPVRAALIQPDAVTLLVTHTRPEVLLGLLPRTGRLQGLGYRNQGGTLDAAGLLIANGCSWLHLLARLAPLQGLPPDALLTPTEQDALRGAADLLPLVRLSLENLP